MDGRRRVLDPGGARGSIRRAHRNLVLGADPHSSIATGMLSLCVLRPTKVIPCFINRLPSYAALMPLTGASTRDSTIASRSVHTV